MKAMILAAGRGERMRPLTDALPKPLLCIAGKPLIVYHIEKLAAIGVKDVIINIAYLGNKIREALGDGSTWGMCIHYSQEPEPLETGGALLRALPLLGDEPFLLINGDVWTDFDFSDLPRYSLKEAMAHLIFVHNPEHNPQGDFSISTNGIVGQDTLSPNYTFSGVMWLKPQMISDYPDKRAIFPLREVFAFNIARQQLRGSVYQGEWCDVGTPARLAELEQQITA